MQPFERPEVDITIDPCFQEAAVVIEDLGRGLWKDLGRFGKSTNHLPFPGSRCCDRRDRMQPSGLRQTSQLTNHLPFR